MTDGIVVVLLSYRPWDCKGHGFKSHHHGFFLSVISTPHTGYNVSNVFTASFQLILNYSINLLAVYGVHCLVSPVWFTPVPQTGRVYSNARVMVPVA